MRKLLMASVAAISFTIMPTIAVAQADVPGSTNSVDDKRPSMSADQQSMYDSWPADRQADYDTWTPEYQTYYWGLSPEYQEGYWALTPEQRTRIYGMAPDQQEAAWKSVAAQLRGAPAPTATGSSSSSTMGSSGSTGTSGMSSGMASSGSAMATSGNIRYISNATVQGGMTTPTAQENYPVCKGNIQDSCINPGAK